MSEGPSTDGEWSKEEYLDHLRQDRAAQNDRHRFSGMLPRMASWFFDFFIIALIIGALAVFDEIVIDGELGVISYHEVVDRQLIEEHRETESDGTTVLTWKVIETRRDRKGRLAKVQIEHSERKKEGFKSEFTLTLPVESDPHWGGKFAWLSLVLELAILVLYFAGMWSSDQQSTLGGRVMRLRIVGYDEGRITPWRALGRLVACIPSLFFAIGFIFIFFTARRQALHDKIAKTLVLRVPKGA